MGKYNRIKIKLGEKKGTSILLVVCLFLIFCVLGISLLDAANANVVGTSEELEKEQTMLYVSSVYEIVNDMIEDGEFSDATTGALPDMVETVAGGELIDGRNQPVSVKLEVEPGTMPIKVHMAITCVDENGAEQTYTIVSTYSQGGTVGCYKRESCGGLLDERP